GMFGAVDRYVPNQQTYSYAAQNPLMYTDPSGECILEFLMGLVIGASAAVGQIHIARYEEFSAEVDRIVAEHPDKFKRVDYTSPDGSIEFMHGVALCPVGASGEPKHSPSLGRWIEGELGHAEWSYYDYLRIVSFFSAAAGARCSQGNNGRINVKTSPPQSSGKLVTNAQANAAAEKLKYTRFRGAGYSMNKPIYSNGKRFITPDRTNHKGGIWKIAYKAKDFFKKGARIGTTDANLNIIGK
ncbi:toxin C-terminal domain-containing protein, partial [bacterium]|nr:toxin C-terminal domain-containing protein [bacterium]